MLPIKRNNVSMESIRSPSSLYQDNSTSSFDIVKTNDNEVSIMGYEVNVNIKVESESAELTISNR